MESLGYKMLYLLFLLAMCAVIVGFTIAVSCGVVWLICALFGLAFDVRFGIALAAVVILAKIL